MEQEINVVGPAVSDLDPQRHMTVGALGLDDAVHAEGRTDAERVPGAIGILGFPGRHHPERRRRRGKWVGHADLADIIEDEGVGVVEATPCRTHLRSRPIRGGCHFLDSGRPRELHEPPIRRVP